jgi:DNA-binding SARP family transcriptional activator
MKPSRSRSILQISMFGGVTIAYGGLEVRLNIRKMQALLAFLALERTRSTRDQLIGRLWSDVPEDNARASLRQNIYQLRQTLSDVGCDYLVSDKLGLELVPYSLETDVDAVLQAAERGEVHPLLLGHTRISETLLLNLEDIDPSFQDWLRAKRQILHDRLVRLLERAAAQEEQDAAAKIDIAQAILNLDPTHEEACRILMRSRAENGDVAGALKVYKALWDLLAADHDMEPSDTTQDLVAKIKIGSIVSNARAPAAESRPTPREQAPAPVLPEAPARISLLINAFRMDGVQADSVHLVHGFRHHLIASLVRFREWYVTDRALPRATTNPLPAISSQYELDATILQAKSTARIVLTLKETGRDIYFWSDTYELILSRWFETQQDVVRRIASSLNVHSSQERLARLSSQPDVSLIAYDRWLRGQATIMRFSSDNWRSAEQLFRDTIREAPNFASAYSSLAQINNVAHITQPGVYRTRERERETIDLGRTAVRLDPLDSRAHLCLGWAYMMAKEYDQAPGHFNLACQLNDNDPWTLISASLAHSFGGSPDQAKAMSALAFEQSLFPTRVMWGYDVTSRFLWGDYEGCVTASKHAANIILNLPAWAAAALHHLGQRDKAREQANAFLEMTRASWRQDTPASDAAMVRWLLHSFPIARRDDWERLRKGVMGAGLPKTAIEHNAW